MRDLWQRLLKDETGVILSSELALVGTVGVLGMVVGLESVSTAVSQELNDLSCAYRSLDQSFNYRSISKGQHARTSGSGYTDLSVGGNNCGMNQTFVNGGGGGNRDNNEFQFQNSNPLPRERIREERILEERFEEIPVVIEEPTRVRALVEECPDDEIIEEHIIRRRVRADCDKSIKADCDKTIKPDVDTTTKPIPKPSANKSKASPKPAVGKVEK